MKFRTTCNSFCVILFFLTIVSSCSPPNDSRYQFDSYSFLLFSDSANLELVSPVEGVFRIRYIDRMEPDTVLYASVEPSRKPILLQQEEDTVILETGNLKAKIYIPTGSISFLDKVGTELTSQAERLSPLEGENVTLTLQPKEKIFGGGFRSVPMNRRGRRLQHENQAHYSYAENSENLNYSIPHFISNRGYMVLFDDPAKGYTDIGKEVESQLSFETVRPRAVYYIIQGDTYKQQLQRYVELTGYQPLPPLWSFGNIQSRFGYKSQSETMEILERTWEADIPVDAVVIDLYWFSEDARDGQMGNLMWDSLRWPNPGLMMEAMEERGVKTVLVSEPFFIDKSAHFMEMDSLGLLGKDSTGQSFVNEEFFFGPASLIDVFDTTAQNWLWNKYRAQKEWGVDGYWGDLGEPEKHPSGIHYSWGTSEDLHGLYGHTWVEFVSRKWKEDFPNERFFMLARAGYAGTQRYGIIPWTGDVARSWSGLRSQLPAMLGMGLSGLGYMHTDAGGFTMAEKDTELYIRWMQMAVFTPVFRPHGDANVAPTELALWPDSVQKVLRPFIELRYKLLPYIYNLASENHKTGLPLVRPMFMEYPDDPEMYNWEDQYMFGRDLLIAPVLKAGVSNRTVYLPEGNWYSLIDKKKWKGGHEVRIPVSLDDIPVFVREGAVIPTIDLISTTQDYSIDTVYLQHFVQQSGTSVSTVFDDDGHTPQQHDLYVSRLLTIESDRSNDQLSYTMSWSISGKNATKKYSTLLFEINGLDNQPKSVELNGQEQPFHWDKKSGLLFVEVDMREAEATLNLML